MAFPSREGLGVERGIGARRGVVAGEVGAIKATEAGLRLHTVAALLALVCVADEHAEALTRSVCSR